MAKKRAGSITCLLTALTISGCAAVRPDFLPETMTGKTLVVMSTVGNQMRLQHIGTTIFQNEYDFHDVTDWDVDTTLERIASELILRDGRFSVRTAAHEGSRAMLEGVGRDWTNTPIYGYGERKEKTRRAARQEQAELVLLLAPMKLYDVFFQTSEFVPGYGIYQRSFLLTKTRHVRYATLQMVLYDGETGEEITWASNFESAFLDGEAWTPGEIGISKNHAKRTMEVVLRVYRMLVVEGLRQMDLARGDQIAQDDVFLRVERPGIAVWAGARRKVDDRFAAQL